MLERIDHIGVAVEDLDGALALYGGQLGLRLDRREVIAEQGVEAALMTLGDSHVELLAPLAPDTPVGRFLLRRGPGLHHVAYQVRDIEQALADARRAGLRAIDDRPRPGIGDTRVAFLHPDSCGGVLTEMVQVAHGEREEPQ